MRTDLLLPQRRCFHCQSPASRSPRKVPDTFSGSVSNLTVADRPNYAVGGHRVLVHNTTVCNLTQGQKNVINGTVFENAARNRLARNHGVPFFRSGRRGGFDDVTLEGGTVVINEEKFVKRLQFDDFTAITKNIRANIREVVDSLPGSTSLSRADKATVRNALHGVLDGNMPANVKIRVVYGNQGPGKRLLTRLASESGLSVEASPFRSL